MSIAKEEGNEWNGMLKKTASGSYLPFSPLLNNVKNKVTKEKAPDDSHQKRLLNDNDMVASLPEKVKENNKEMISEKNPAEDSSQKRVRNDKDTELSLPKRLKSGYGDMFFSQEELEANVPRLLKTGYGMTPEMTPEEKRHYDLGYSTIAGPTKQPELLKPSNKMTLSERRHLDAGVRIDSKLFDDCMVEKYELVYLPSHGHQNNEFRNNFPEPKSGKPSLFPNEDEQQLAFQALISELEAVAYKVQILTLISKITDVTELKRIARVGARTNIDLIREKMNSLTVVFTTASKVDYHSQQYQYLLRMMRYLLERYFKKSMELSIAEQVLFISYL